MPPTVVCRIRNGRPLPLAFVNPTARLVILSLAVLLSVPLLVSRLSFGHPRFAFLNKSSKAMLCFLFAGRLAAGQEAHPQPPPPPAGAKVVKCAGRAVP